MRALSAGVCVGTKIPVTALIYHQVLVSYLNFLRSCKSFVHLVGARAGVANTTMRERWPRLETGAGVTLREAVKVRRNYWVMPNVWPCKVPMD